MSQSVNFPQEPLAFILWLQTPFSYELLIRSKAFFFFFSQKPSISYKTHLSVLLSLRQISSRHSLRQEFYWLKRKPGSGSRNKGPRLVVRGSGPRGAAHTTPSRATLSPTCLHVAFLVHPKKLLCHWASRACPGQEERVRGLGVVWFFIPKGTPSPGTLPTPHSLEPVSQPLCSLQK